MENKEKEVLLKVRGAKTYFPIKKGLMKRTVGYVKAVDDISLDVGRLRIRADGSAGGHNGMKSIIGGINSQSFPRVKIGVGAKPHPDYDLASWVLSNFSPEEEKLLQPAVKDAADAALLLLEQGVQAAAGKYNGRKPG